MSFASAFVSFLFQQLQAIWPNAYAPTPSTRSKSRMHVHIAITELQEKVVFVSKSSQSSDCTTIAKIALLFVIRIFEDDLTTVFLYPAFMSYISFSLCNYS